MHFTKPFEEHEKTTVPERLKALRKYFTELSKYLYEKYEERYVNDCCLCFALTYERQFEIELELDRVRCVITTLESCHV